MEITFALTSCGRLDLLERTIDSFLKFNSYPIAAYIISEDDSSCDLSALKEKYKHLNFYWIQNPGPRRGFLPNIDFLYKHVTTPWVFHCEDDWEFYAPDFIEPSLDILLSNNDLLQVWLRHPEDTNGHPLDKAIYKTKGKVKYKLLSLDYLCQFSGYTTNPGLRRLKDKVCFEAISMLGPGFIGPEGKVNIYYKQAGFRSAILLPGYVRHIGEGRTTIA